MHNIELFDSIKNIISSFQNPIKSFLLPFLNDLQGIEPSKFAIDAFNNFFENVSFDFKTLTSYNDKIKNALISNMLEICKHYCSEKEKVILEDYRRTYNPEFKQLKLLCHKKYELEEKNKTSSKSQKINLIKEIKKIDDKIAVCKSNCLEISRQAFQTINIQNSKNIQQQK